jgi:hypothetical protein
VRLPVASTLSPAPIGHATLGRLRAYWKRQRGGAAVPPADGLYLSDLAAELPHVLMCFRDETAFRVEFAGAEVQDLLGFDPTGELLRSDDTAALLAGVARGGDLSAARRRPELTLGAGWMAIELPFVEEDDRVSVLLIGLVGIQAGQSAEILEFRPL